MACLILATFSILERAASFYFVIRSTDFTDYDDFCLPSTVIFFVLPIICNSWGAITFIKEGNKGCSKTVLGKLALLAHLPLAMFFFAVVMKVSDDDTNAAKQRNKAIACQMVEIFFGALPQFCLQLFILGKYGEYDAAFCFALLAEALFVLYGVVCLLSVLGRKLGQKWGVVSSEEGQTEGEPRGNSDGNTGICISVIRLLYLFFV